MTLSSAAVVMEIAEQIYKSLQKQRERHMITRGMPKNIRNKAGQLQQKNVTLAARKRGIDKAFSELYDSDFEHCYAYLPSW